MIQMTQIASRILSEPEVPRKLDGALTVDLEDWRCALNPTKDADYKARPQLNEEYLVRSTANMLRVLENAGAKATFFVLGEVAQAVPEVVREVSRRGHEVASHSPVHLPVDKIPRDKLETMILRDAELLEELAGRRPLGFRAPYLAISRKDGWLFEILAKSGFVYDSSVAPTWTPYWGIPSAPKRAYFPDTSDLAMPSVKGKIIEFPLTVWPSWRMLPGLPIAGGFYMRAWPPSVMRWMLRRNTEAGVPLNLYIHQGNIESEKERVPNPSVRDKISQYVWSARGMSSFQSILAEFKFGTLYDVHKEEIDGAEENRKAA